MSLAVVAAVKVAPLVVAVVVAAPVVLGNCLLSQCLLAPATPSLLAEAVRVVPGRIQTEARGAIQAHLDTLLPAVDEVRLVRIAHRARPMEATEVLEVAPERITVLALELETKAAIPLPKEITGHQKARAILVAVAAVLARQHLAKMVGMVLLLHTAEHR